MMWEKSWLNISCRPSRNNDDATENISTEEVQGEQTVFFLFSIVPFLCCLLLSSTEQAGIFLDTTNDSYAILTGYGQSFPGWGMTTQRVETIDLVLRHNHPVANFDK